MPGVEKMDERLLAAVLVAPFVIFMVGSAVAIAFVLAARQVVANRYDLPLPHAVETWSVVVNSKDLNYGQVHEMIHRDISVGNDYRKERIKHLTTLATGVFALTVTFHKDLFGATLTKTGLCLMLIGWAMLIISLLAGIVHFRKWEDFYLEHRAQGNALWHYRTALDQAGRDEARIAFHRAGSKIRALQESYKKWNIIQSGGLLAGMTFIAIYVGVMGFAVVSSEKHNGTRGLYAPSEVTAPPSK
jgi:hypothetical protein